MTGTQESDDIPSWTTLFDRAPEHISEATIRELLTDHRSEDEQ